MLDFENWSSLELAAGFDFKSQVSSGLGLPRFEQFWAMGVGNHGKDGNWSNVLSIT